MRRKTWAASSTPARDSELGNLTDQRWRNRKRRQLRRRGVPEEEVMRLVPPGHVSDARRARATVIAKYRSADCPDWYREMLGDDADIMWDAGYGDIGDK